MKHDDPRREFNFWPKKDEIPEKLNLVCHELSCKNYHRVNYIMCYGDNDGYYKLIGFCRIDAYKPHYIGMIMMWFERYNMKIIKQELQKFGINDIMSS